MSRNTSPQHIKQRNIYYNNGLNKVSETRNCKELENHLHGSFVAEQSGDGLESVLIGSFLLTHCQDDSVSLPGTVAGFHNVIVSHKKKLLPTQ